MAFLSSLKRSYPTFYAQTGDHVATRHIYEFLSRGFSFESEILEYIWA